MMKNSDTSELEQEEKMADAAGTEGVGETEGADEAQTAAGGGAKSGADGETAADGGEQKTAEGQSETALKSEEPVQEEPEDGDARYLRLAADFQNYKKRVEREKSEIYSYANEKIALDIIEVMDNFERALTHSEECADKQFAEGVSMIYKQLKGVLDKNNIVEIKAEGEDFDPKFHNAVMAEENPDFESGKVIQALQKGYTLNDKVIRPSMVRVAQ